MSTVTPPSSPPPPPAQAQLVRTTIVSAPLTLADLPPGIKIDVVVEQLLDTALLKLNSSLGDITIKFGGHPNVKVGDAFILQLLGGGTSTRAQLLTPSGQPLNVTQSPASGLSTSLNSAPTTAQQTIAEPVMARPGAIITANLLRPMTINGSFQLVTAPTAPASGISGPQQPAISPGTPGVIPPGTVPGAPPLATGTTPGVAPGSAPATIPGAQSAQTFPNGSPLVVKIVSINVPTTAPTSLTPAPSDTPVSLAPGAPLTGVVSGRQGIGQTVVQTHAGPISLPTAEALPPGTTIKFEVVSLTPPPPGSTLHASQSGGAAPLLDGEWESLDEALHLLRDAAPGAHTHLMQTALPRSDSQLSTNVLFFLSVLRGGNMKNWLGDGPVRILERQRPELAAKLRTDMNQMTRNIDDPLTGDWRMHGVPFLHGGEIDRLQFLVRDQNEEDDSDDPNKGDTRFVIDLNLTNLGHLQIDGLVGEKNKRLDVVLRTDTPLQPYMREDIRKLYSDALELTGLDGSVGFQAAPGNFIDIPKSGPTVTVPSGGMVI